MFEDTNITLTDLDTPFHFSFAIDLTQTGSPLVPSTELYPGMTL